MARITVDIERTSRAGMAATYRNANVDGHAFKPGRATVLHVKQGTGARVITIPFGPHVDGQTIAPKSVTVPGNSERYIGGFTPDYIQADGTVYVNYDATTNTTIAFIEVPES